MPSTSSGSILPYAASSACINSWASQMPGSGLCQSEKPIRNRSGLYLIVVPEPVPFPLIDLALFDMLLHLSTPPVASAPLKSSGHVSFVLEVEISVTPLPLSASDRKSLFPREVMAIHSRCDLSVTQGLIHVGGDVFAPCVLFLFIPHDCHLDNRFRG